MIFKKLLWVVAVIPMSLFGQIQGDRFSSLPALSAEQDKSIDADGLEHKYPGQDAVYLERITDFENVIVASSTSGYDWTLLSTEYKKMVVFNPENDFYSTLTIEVPKDHELGQVSLSIWTPSGTYRQFGVADLKESRDSDGSATYKFAFPDVKKGSVITEAYVVKQLYCFRDAPLSYQVPLQYVIPCEKASFRIVYPYDWEMGIKKSADDKVLPVTIVKDKKADKNIMSYTAENVPAVQNEPFSPFYREVAIFADVQVLKLNMRISHYHPINYKAPKDWSELSDRFKEYVMDRDPVFSGRVEQKTKELTADSKTDFEKLDAIITWLQLNMRSVGYFENKATGLDRGNFADNLQRLEGTVSQITGLALSMLQKANIDSKYLLMHSAKDGYFDSGFFSFCQLETPAVLARIQDKSYVVFPYRRRMPVDYVPEEYQGQKALAIDRKGNSEFIQIPLGSQSANETSESYKLTFLEDGKIRVEEERILKGSAAYTTRRNLAGLTYRETEKELKRMLTFSEGKVTLKSHAVIDQQEYKKPLKIQLEYELENMVTLTPEEVIFNTGGLFTPVSRVRAKDSAKDRQNPIRIYFDETVKKTITMNFPATWLPSTKLEDFKLENPFGAIQGTYSSSQGMLTGEQVLVLKKAAEPKESYPDLQALTGKKTRHSIPAIVFKVKH